MAMHYRKKVCLRLLVIVWKMFAMSSTTPRKPLHCKLQLVAKIKRVLIANTKISVPCSIVWLLSFYLSVQQCSTTEGYALLKDVHK